MSCPKDFACLSGDPCVCGKELDKPEQECYTIRVSLEEYRTLYKIIEGEYYKRMCDYNQPPKDHEAVKKVLDKLKKV